MIGESLGPYKILEPLGAGGMGEVYLGEDTRLGRKVAIKVLPAEFAADPERLARFEQEARAAAALNHPHIAVVHDVGSEATEDGTTTHFMVQEYLEGQSLRERLDKGALPLDKALDLSIEVGEALVAAHKAGIVHRDLKPDNIFVTEEGHAKVLDFGLAKLTEVAAPVGSELSMSPTMIGTVAGQVMGTAGYMAPEQVNGEEVDQRADLFAFGCILYGVVTGRQAFGGKNVHETLGHILSDEPAPIAEIDMSLPSELQRIVRKLLAKEADRRYQTAGDLNVDLRQLQDDIISGVTAPTDVPGKREAAPRGSLLKLALPMTLAALLAGSLATWWATRPEPAPPEMLGRFEILLPEGVNFTNTGQRTVAVSPDGSTIAFVGNSQLWIRARDQLEPRVVPGIDTPSSPFFSPDGRSVGFLSGGEIATVLIADGLVNSLAPAGRLFGASWADDGWIYYGQDEDGIWRVPENGGEPENVITGAQGEWVHGPQLLPGGEVMFTVTNSEFSSAAIVAQSWPGGDRKVLVSVGTEGRYLASGHLVFAREGTLLAAPLDVVTLEPVVGSIPVASGVEMAFQGITGAAQYSLTDAGELVYVPGGSDQQIVWVDRETKNVDALPIPPGIYYLPRLSPRDEHLALAKFEDEEYSIDVIDVTTGATQPLTSGLSGAFSPVWSPDGQWIYFSAETDATMRADIFRRRADLSEAAEPFYSAEGDQLPRGIPDDGSVLLYSGAGNRSAPFGLIPIEDAPEASAPAAVLANGNRPRISPDGRFVAFADGGRLYVMEAATRRREPVSATGIYPAWSHDSKEVFFRSAAGARSVAPLVIDNDGKWDVGAQSPVFQIASFASAYDITEDGERFLGMVPAATINADGMIAPRIVVVLNWFEELKRLLPTGR